jgi:hypothetical protein
MSSILELFYVSIEVVLDYFQVSNWVLNDYLGSDPKNAREMHGRPRYGNVGLLLYRRASHLSWASAKVLAAALSV